MSILAEAFCPHDRRPSTAICLRCRREARMAAQARHRRVLAGIGGVALALAVMGIAGISGAAAFTSWRPPSWLQHANFSLSTTRPPIADEAVAAAASPVRGTHAPNGVALNEAAKATAPALTPSISSSPSAAPPAPRLATPRLAGPPLAPILAEGRTVLHDSVVAVRTGASVTVHFDTPGGRTRRADKFERIVRATLPAVYGPAVDSLLASLPQGSLARAGNLLTDLPKRGLRLSLGTGWTLALWPETRLGHDGPLVVTYRAVVTR